MIIILLAALSMVIQDILEVLKDQAQNRHHKALAGLADTLMWLALISSTTISVTVLQGHDLTSKVEAIIFISLANFVGQYTGVAIGDRFVK